MHRTDPESALQKQRGALESSVTPCVSLPGNFCHGVYKFEKGSVRPSGNFGNPPTFLPSKSQSRNGSGVSLKTLNTANGMGQMLQVSFGMKSETIAFAQVQSAQLTKPVVHNGSSVVDPKTLFSRHGEKILFHFLAFHLQNSRPCPTLVGSRNLTEKPRANRCRESSLNLVVLALLFPRGTFRFQRQPIVRVLVSYCFPPLILAPTYRVRDSWPSYRMSDVVLVSEHEVRPLECLTFSG